MSEQITNLRKMISELETEYTKFEKGNQTAGIRARKKLQEIKVTCQDMRVSISETKAKSK